MSEYAVKTVFVADKAHPLGYREINEADYDEKTHGKPLPGPIVKDEPAEGEGSKS